MLQVGGSLLLSNSNWSKRQEVRDEEAPAVATCVDHGLRAGLTRWEKKGGGAPGRTGLRGFWVSPAPSGLCDGQDTVLCNFLLTASLVGHGLQSLSPPSPQFLNRSKMPQLKFDTNTRSVPDGYGLSQ